MPPNHAHDTPAVEGRAPEQQSLSVGVPPGDGWEPCLTVEPAVTLQELVAHFPGGRNDQQSRVRRHDAVPVVDGRDPERVSRLVGLGSGD